MVQLSDVLKQISYSYPLLVFQKPAISYIIIYHKNGIPDRKQDKLI